MSASVWRQIGIEPFAHGALSKLHIDDIRHSKRYAVSCNWSFVRVFKRSRPQSCFERAVQNRAEIDKLFIAVTRDAYTILLRIFTLAITLRIGGLNDVNAIANRRLDRDLDDVPDRWFWSLPFDRRLLLGPLLGNCFTELS